MQHAIQHTYTVTRKSLNEIYKKRKRTLLFQKLAWGLMGVYLVLMLLGLIMSYLPQAPLPFASFFKLFQATPDNPFGTMFPILGFMVLVYLSSFLFTKAFQQFKIKESQTITVMVKNLFPQVDFAQGTAAPTKEIIKSKLFAYVHKDSAIYNFGQIRSKSKEVLINIADIGMTEKNTTNTFLTTLLGLPVLGNLYKYVFKNIVSSKSADNQNFTFRGMFCWLQFQKKLKGHTVVLPNTQSAKFDRFASFNFKEEQRIYLEDTRFTAQFVVYSTDQVEARYVLSTALMERIVLLKETFNQPILLSFQDKAMFLAVQNTNGLFSFPSGKLDSVAVIKELAEAIDTALQIPKYLNFRTTV